MSDNKEISLHEATQPDSAHGFPRIKVVVRGEGTKDYVFPNVDELVNRGLKRVKREGLKISRPTGGIEDITAEEPRLPLKPVRFFDFLQPSRWFGSPNEPVRGKTLVSGSSGLQGLMARRQFDAIVEERFGQLIGSVRWARKHMGKKYLPAVLSLDRQLDQLRATYVQALPRLLSELASQNKGVPTGILLENAVRVLDQELAEIIFVLRAYTDCFTQYRDGIYERQLRAVNFLFDQAFLLFQTGDPTGCVDGSCAPRIETSSFQVGDVFVSRFSGLPLGTIPGSRGPIGAHALQVPFDLLDILSIQFPLLAHEFRHNVFNDVHGLEQELTTAVEHALIRAHKTGELKLKSDYCEVGGGRVATINLLVRMAADCMGEIDADIAGGVLLSGPAYLYSMLLSFPAMIQGNVLRARQLLRTTSTYQFGRLPEGGVGIKFAPHPPDYARAYLVAAALDEIGFGKEAAECRELADFAVGSVPNGITWIDSRDRLAPVRLLTDDIKAMAPVVARALIRTNLKSLGGKSMGDLVMWTPNRQAKVDTLVQKLLAGDTSVPEGGDVYATYVGSAATMAYWNLASGLRRPEAEAIARQVNSCALTMLDTLRERAEQK